MSEQNELEKKVLEKFDAMMVDILKFIHESSLSTKEKNKRIKAIADQRNLIIKSIPKDPTDEELFGMYKEFGIDVSSPKGKCWHSQTMVVAYHDNVPYCMDEHGDYLYERNIKAINQVINHRQLIIDRHHDKVKKVYQYLLNKNIGDIWVLSGGGAQLQAFFGNNKGYLAILYLDMVDQSDIIDDEYMRLIGNSVLSLTVQSEHNNQYFKDLKVDNIEIEYSQCVRD